MGIGAEAAERVVVGRKGQHRFGHGRQQAGHGVQQRVGRATFGPGQHVLARASIQAGVDVHAAARAIAIGLGHERRAQAMVRRQRAHDPLHQHGIVGGGECVGAVQQVQFVLPRSGLADHGVGGDAHGVGHLHDLVEQRDMGGERVVESVSLRAMLPSGGTGTP
jgi:hypothetical protein